MVLWYYHLLNDGIAMKEYTVNPTIALCRRQEYPIHKPIKILERQVIRRTKTFWTIRHDDLVLQVPTNSIEGKEKNLGN
jgi:hypothetical protein